MGRRKKKRMVEAEPCAVFYKPQGIPMRELESLVLSVEGLETLRLVDGERMQQIEAADRMGVSRPTLSRILTEARTTVALALSGGKAIRVEGGEYLLASETCCKLRRRRRCQMTTGTGDAPDGETTPSPTEDGNTGE
ncbi:MAG: DUF134 domain-containing protein [Pseudomonadota bacterium]